ncbi:AAA family ATPase [Cryobacterium sp. TMT3-29-2]|uniref:AAA family ATPase n=1 Tax=Cryobacterium sp. TMT3-29-2 TaxID=2555867 RepID=UPI001431DB21|nr:AAA family ATPase [Cryobacterium sp. TMT3-29-2]
MSEAFDNKRIAELLGKVNDSRPDVGGNRRTKRRRASDMTPKKTWWAWQNYVPMGALTIIAGTAGVGKSTILTRMAADWSKGVMAGDLAGKPVNVLMAAGEDDFERQVVPRLTAAGADLTRIEDFVVEMDTTTVKGVETMFRLGDDLDSLRADIEDSGARIIILDPIISFMDGSPDRPKEVRMALDPVAKLAQELNVAIIAVMHWRKGHGSIAEKLSGAHAWRDICRSYIAVAREPGTNRTIAQQDKNNYGPDGDCWAYELTQAPVEVESGEWDEKGEPITETQLFGVAVYLGPSSTSVDDLLAQDKRTKDGRSAGDQIKDDILSFIMLAQEPVTPAQILEHMNNIDGEGVGYGMKQPALVSRLKRMVANHEIAQPTYGHYGRVVDPFAMPFESVQPAVNQPPSPSFDRDDWD